MIASRLTHLVVVFLAALTLVTSAPRAFAQPEDEQDQLEEPLDEADQESEEPQDQLDEDLPEEDVGDVGDEGAIVPILPRLPFQRKRPTPLPAQPEVFVGEAGEEEGGDQRKVMIDGMVSLNYVFNNAPESFIVNYHFRIEGDTKARTAVIRGEANIDAKVEGALAKWSGGECKLNITIPKAPFQVTFRRNEDEEEASINLRFTKPIMEEWESECNFGEGVKPFVTKGTPEKWLERALSRTSPPMRSLVAKLSGDEKTTSNFLISKHQVNDPPLGTIEIEGKGIITIIPAGVEEETE
jgi:hypothetical protein